MIAVLRRAAINTNIHFRVTIASLALSSVVSQFARMAHTSKHGHRLIESDDGTLQLEPRDGPVTGAVIFMHGLGDTSEGWIDACSAFAPSLPHVRFILPTAPVRPITVNMGMPMPGWYDIVSLARKRLKGAVCEGLDESVKRVTAMVDKEVAGGIPAHRVVLGGFSQGGAMSLTTGLNYPQKLAGMLIMSGYLPSIEAVKANANSVKTPILFLHGDSDEVLPLEVGQEAMEQVKLLGAADVTFNVYRGLPHSANDKELRDARDFLLKVLPGDVKSEL